jgi:HAD superfamily hydrolase (TIGR01484 family)
MKYKLCVFDIDGVLNPAGKPVQKESIQAIEKLEEHGLKISFASGKHPWYIMGGLVFSGLLREDTVIIGEAGGNVFFHKPKKSILYPKHIKDIKKLRKIFYKQKIFTHKFWEEPKEAMFTIFPEQPQTVPSLADGLERIIQKEKLNLYTIRQVDAVDVMQNGLSKTVGLKVLCNHLNISLREMIAFGDGMNDFEMLEHVGYPVAVANAVKKIKKLVEKRKEEEVAGYISSMEYGDGVLEAVYHLISNKTI